MSNTGGMGLWGERPPEIEGIVVEDELGRGGSAVVYRARTLDGKVVALKVLKKSVDPDELEACRQFAAALHATQWAGRAGGGGLEEIHREPRASLTYKRFEREARMHLAVRGKGFVDCLDAGTDRERRPYFILELMSGGTLRDRLKCAPVGLPVDDVVRLGSRLADILAEAHLKGLVHRDVKPENILFTANGEPRISDLGIAKHYDRNAPGATGTQVLSNAGEARGTIVYMAPEQMSDASSVGPGADVFALGVVLYECLTGQLPFRGGTAVEIQVRALEGRYVPPRRSRTDAPAFLAKIIERSLRPDPKDRFTDAGAVSVAFTTRVVDDSPLGVGGENTAVTMAARPRHGRLWLAFGALLAATVLVGVLAWRKSIASAPTVAPSMPSQPRPQASATPRSAAPAWYRELPLSERPQLPLPAGISFGAEPRTYENQKDGSKLVFVPAGSFLMGTEEGDEIDKPLHEVSLSPFFIGIHEVTTQEFRAFVRATNHATTAEGAGRGAANDVGRDLGLHGLAACTWRDPFGTGEEAHADDPVVQVSWLDAAAYAQWAGVSLPTEAQWEKAATWNPVTRKKVRYAWGDAAPNSTEQPKVANIADEAFASDQPRDVRIARPELIEPSSAIFRGYNDGFARLAPVCSFPAGRSFYGAFDMTGNVAEWCADGFSRDKSAYSELDTRDPFVGRVLLREGYCARIVRGGSWLDGPRTALAAVRAWYPEQSHHPDVGFRVAVPVSAK